MELRPTEVDWKQVLVRLLMDYQVCGCGFQGFSGQLMSQKNGTLVCPVCGRTYYVLSNGMDEILLTEGAKLYACQTGRDAFDKDTVTALWWRTGREKVFTVSRISAGASGGDCFPMEACVRSGKGRVSQSGTGCRFVLKPGKSGACVWEPVRVRVDPPENRRKGPTDWNRNKTGQEKAESDR